MTALPVFDAPRRPMTILMNRAMSVLSRPFRLIAISWMEWSKFEYELFRARSHDKDLRG